MLHGRIPPWTASLPWAASAAALVAALLVAALVAALASFLQGWGAVVSRELVRRLAGKRNNPFS